MKRYKTVLCDASTLEQTLNRFESESFSLEFLVPHADGKYTAVGKRDLSRAESIEYHREKVNQILKEKENNGEQK